MIGPFADLEVIAETLRQRKLAEAQAVKADEYTGGAWPRSLDPAVRIAALEAKNERLEMELKNARDAFCMYLSASTRGAAAVWSRELG